MSVDLIIPVPFHSKRLKKRGYNHFNAFTRLITKSLGATYAENALTKVIDNKAQVFQSKKRALEFYKTQF